MVLFSNSQKSNLGADTSIIISSNIIINPPSNDWTIVFLWINELRSAVIIVNTAQLRKIINGTPAIFNPKLSP